ncbi:hypothetical protein ACLOJK_008610 [Asimina triloba]
MQRRRKSAWFEAHQSSPKASLRDRTLANHGSLKWQMAQLTFWSSRLSASGRRLSSPPSSSCGGMAAAIFMAPAQGLLSRAARKVLIPRAHLFNPTNCNLSFLQPRFQPPTNIASSGALHFLSFLSELHEIWVSSRREILQTGFLTPPIVKEAMLMLEKFSDVKAVAQGGYPEAERCRIVIGHAEGMKIIPDAVAAISITGNFGFQPCSHGDFLGSILGAGISRESVGDILLQVEKGAQVIVVPELVDFLLTTLTKVGNVSVSCSKMPLLALEYEPPRTKSFKTIEASLRVDALASAGFKISRSKLVDLISNGDVRVNWSPVTKNGTTLKSGDVVSVSGKGRLKGLNYWGDKRYKERKMSCAVETKEYCHHVGADLL